MLQGRRFVRQGDTWSGGLGEWDVGRLIVATTQMDAALVGANHEFGFVEVLYKLRFFNCHYRAPQEMSHSLSIAKGPDTVLAGAGTTLLNIDTFATDGLEYAEELSGNQITLRPYSMYEVYAQVYRNNVVACSVSLAIRQDAVPKAQAYENCSSTGGSNLTIGPALIFTGSSATSLLDVQATVGGACHVELKTLLIKALI
jgi:hypothetical protein